MALDKSELSRSIDSLQQQIEELRVQVLPQGGHTAESPIDEPVPPPLGDISEEDIEKLKIAPQTKSSANDPFPLGTLLAWFPYKAEAPPAGWVIAAGQVITIGPYAPKNAPNLMDNRFLMGSNKRVGHGGGRNKIAFGGGHTHEWKDASGGHGKITTRDRAPHPQEHKGHSHGDNRPRFFGCLYIFKIA